MNAKGSGSFSDIIAGIEAAMDPDGNGDYSDHADVVSMSIGGAGNSKDILSQAVENAHALTGAVFCIAAGNLAAGQTAGYGTLSSPGTAPSAITVGACTKDIVNGTIASFSLQGPDSYELAIKPEIVAPGVNISSTVRVGYDQIGNGTVMSGTSMATPLVAGVCALLKQMHPDWTSSQIKSALMSSAVSLNNADGVVYDAMTQGAGRTDALAASNVKTFFERVSGEGTILGNDLSFGLVDAVALSQNGNQTKTVTLKITNTHNSPQTYTFTTGTLPLGVSLTLPQATTLNAGQFTVIDIPLTVTTAVADQRIQTGIITVSGTYDTNMHLTWSFVKNSVWWVDDDAAAGPLYSGTETDPKLTIQSAIDVAGDYDFIFVKNGTYAGFYITNQPKQYLTIASEFYFTQDQVDIIQTSITNEGSSTGMNIYFFGEVAINCKIIGFNIIGDNTNTGIYASGTQIDISNCILQNHHRAIDLQYSNCYINESQIIDNIGNGAGVALATSWASFVRLDNSIIMNNESTASGGTSSSILNTSTLNIHNCIISHNKGGVATIFNQGNIKITESKLYNNTSQYAVCQDNPNGASLEIFRCQVHDNIRSIYGNYGTINIEFSEFYNNSSKVFHFNRLDEANIRNSILKANNILGKNSAQKKQTL